MFSCFPVKAGGGGGGRAKIEPPLAFFAPCFIVIFGQFDANSCYEAKCDLVGFPLFERHFGCFGFGVLKPNSPFVLVDPPKWPSLQGVVWLRENGTICPFGIVSPVLWQFSAQFEASPCDEPSCGLVAFSLV